MSAEYSGVMDWLNDVVVPLAVVVSAATAALAAVAQGTKGARLRRRAEFFRVERDGASTEHDRAVLDSMHREVVGTLVSMHVVPLREFLRMIALLASTIAFQFYVGALLAAMTADPKQPWPVLTAIVTVVTFLVGIGTSWWICNVTLERRDVIKLYLDGADIEKVNTSGILPEVTAVLGVKGLATLSLGAAGLHLFCLTLGYLMFVPANTTTPPILLPIAL